MHLVSEVLGQSWERVAERYRAVPDADLLEDKRAPLGHAHRVHQTDVKPLVCGPDELIAISSTSKAFRAIGVLKESEQRALEVVSQEERDGS